jgi:hypothetical protein
MNQCTLKSMQICFLTAILIAAASTLVVVSPIHGQTSFPAAHVDQPKRLIGQNLTVYLTIYGINSTTGQLDTFAKARDMVKFSSFNSTLLESQQNKTDGTVLNIFNFQNLTMNTGEPFTTCVVVLKAVKMVCNTDYKAPSARPQFVDISIS